MFAITDNMKKRWIQLSKNQKRFIIITAIIELLLLVSALLDIIIRPSTKIKGSKIKWVLISLIEFFGPLSYFVFGRKK